MREGRLCRLILFLSAGPLLFSQQARDFREIYKEGTAFMSQGRYTDGVARMKECIGLQSQSSSSYVPYFHLGYAYYRMGLADEKSGLGEEAFDKWEKAKAHLLEEERQGAVRSLPMNATQLDMMLKDIEKRLASRAASQDPNRIKVGPGPAREIDKNRARQIKEQQLKGLSDSPPGGGLTPAAPTLPATGTLKIVTEPQADILINGRPYGRTDERGEMQLSLAPSSYEILASKEGFEGQADREIARIAAGQRAEIRIVLTRTQPAVASVVPRAARGGLNGSGLSSEGGRVTADFYHPDVVESLKKDKDDVWIWLKYVAFTAIGLMFLITYLVYRRRFAVQPDKGPGAGRAAVELGLGGSPPARSEPSSAAPGKADLPDTKEWGDYRLLKLIKKTSMSSIYLASHKDKKERYAIKVPHEEKLKDEAFRRRFLTEASLSSKLLHENIVEIYDVGERGATPYFVMEYVEGRSLRDILREKGTLSEKVAVEVLTKVCQALYYAHNLTPPLIHKDIKPENILLKVKSDRVEELKLIDFGISGDFTRAVSGTPPYISREQILGEPLDGRADIFSLGVLAFEMFVGRKLFEPKGFEETTQILSDTRTPFGLPAPMNPDLAKMLGRMLQKRKDDRYRSVEEILKDLRTYRFKYLHKEAK